jgi:eukaryotic-like serine/threonine-protein kinase
MKVDRPPRGREDRPARSAGERVDQVCDRFESAWRKGPRPLIEDFLAEIPVGERQELLLELVATELELRRGGGEDPGPREYASRFSGYDVLSATIFDLATDPGRSAHEEAALRGPLESTVTDPRRDDAASRSERRMPAVTGYEVLRELGRGGMGVVYLARQLRLNRRCALKMILAGAHSSPESSRRFLAEAETIARIEHPNVVQIHHIGEADGLPFFELEYVAGGSLDRALDGTPWPPREAAKLVEAMTQGVAEAHRLGVVHRDLKPANVLLGDDGNPRITDFGLAKAMGIDTGLTRTESVLGSPSYMAPEQAAERVRSFGAGRTSTRIGAASLAPDR